MRKCENTLNSNKGITLIALVVTIIVLLILAGISISMLTGQNGILNRAQEAKEKTEKAQKEEQDKLGSMEDTINEYTTGIEVEQVTDENPGVLEGTGTDDDPYTINSIEDLVCFSYDVNNGNTYEGQTVKLALSLDFNSNKSYVEPLRTNYEEYGYDGELKTLLTTGEGFKPIGTYLNTNTSVTDETNKSFRGIFDGNGYEIDGLRIASEEKGKGLFGLINNGVVRNLIIGENSNIDAGVSLGAIVGYSYNNSSVENCINKANLKASGTNFGGIVGTNIEGCNVERCINIGSMEGKETSGGIVGNNSGNVSYCYNEGVINADNTAGGICAYNTGIIENSYNKGEITSETSNVGGIAATISNNGTVKNCYNTGKVTGTGSNVGGVVGYMMSENNQISNCYNTGYVTTEDNLGGGVLGYMSAGSVENCYSLENVVNGENGRDIAGIEIKSSEELKNLASILGSAFKSDTNKNNGYPILAWE